MAIMFVETKGARLSRGERVRGASPESKTHLMPTVKYDSTATWTEVVAVPKGANSVVVSNASTEAIAVSILNTRTTSTDYYHVILPGQFRMLLTSAGDRVMAKTA